MMLLVKRVGHVGAPTGVADAQAGWPTMASAAVQISTQEMESSVDVMSGEAF
jgi:hypothetical protein